MNRMTNLSSIATLTPVGLIGGMGWESSAVYYRIVNEEIRRRFGGTRSAVCRLDSLDFAQLEPFVSTDDWASLTQVLAAAALRLQSGGARVLALCSNTAHIAADAISAATHLPLIHIADPVARLALAVGARRVGVLATRPTLEQGILASRWRDRFDLVVVEPTEIERSWLNACIYERLLAGVHDRHDGKLLSALAMSLIDRGAQAIILACTDLASHFDPGSVRVPVFDSADAHARAIAAAIELELKN